MVSILTGAEHEAPSGPSDEYPEMEITPIASGAAAANLAAKDSNGEILVFLRDRVIQAEDGWLTELVSHVLRPGIGASGGRLCSSSGYILDGALILGLGGVASPAFLGFPSGHPGYFNRGLLQQDLSAISCACLAVRRDVFLRLGGFNALCLPHHLYDIDFCLRLRAEGLRVIWTPYANLVLAEDEVAEPLAEETDYMQDRWGYELRHDPFYSPNLSLQPPGFTLADPPRI